MKIAQDMQRCFRCHGRKQIFKVGGAYSHIDTGGIEVDCPLCLAEGVIKKLTSSPNDVKDVIKPIRGQRGKKQDS